MKSFEKQKKDGDPGLGLISLKFRFMASSVLVCNGLESLLSFVAQFVLLFDEN